jgi:negative regulator of flagellin synthesis FlgM
MKVEGTGFEPVKAVKPSKVTHGRKADTASKPRASVSLSAFAEDVKAAQKAMSNIPDVRMEKIARISKQIQDGTYKVDAQKLADAMLNSILGR